MEHLPENDIPMLVSAINFLLRDEIYDNLDEICYHYNVDREELEKKLAADGYHYDREQNRIW